MTIDPADRQRYRELTLAEAAAYAAEGGAPLATRTIRKAAARGLIPGARKAGRDWLVTHEGLNHYLDHRPKPGRPRRYLAEPPDSGRGETP